MQLTSLYTRYFQKSKSFLYPLLGIAKGAYAQPMQTYICMKHHSGLVIKPKDKKLICLFEDTDSKEFKAFEQAYLINNPYYLETIPGPMTSKLYIFNLKKHAGDWNKFLKGKYSEFSNLAKVKIKEYYGHHTLEYTYMRSFLFPEYYWEDYANFLDVPVSIIKDTHELCDLYNVDKECINIEEQELELI